MLPPACGPAGRGSPGAGPVNPGASAERLLPRFADQALAETRELKLVLQEMDRLPRAERHVLLLSASEEMKTAEIAEVLGKSESAVRALLFRARGRLRERLDGRSNR